MDAKQEGALLQQVADIKTNTDKIPDMAIMLARHEDKINSMIPKVESHERLGQRAIALSALFATLAGVFSWIIKDSSR